MCVVVYSVKERAMRFVNMAPGTKQHADAITPNHTSRSRGERLRIRMYARRFPSVFAEFR